jgi:signal transduction histidine kinase
MQTHDVQVRSRILIVDDEPYLVQSLNRLLKHKDREIFIVENAFEAFNVLSGNEVHLLISDYHMPGMNGLELIKKAGELYPHMITILLTGHGDHKLAKSLINSGSVYRYIEKPWEDEDLLSSVNEGLEKFRLEEMNRKLQESLKTRNTELENLAAGLESSIYNLKSELDQTIQNSKINEQLAEVGMSTTQIAHDLRNPLTVLSTGLFLLRHKNDETSLDRNINVMEKALDQLTSMVETLPTYVKQIAAEKKLESVNLDSFLGGICDLMNPIVESKGIVLSRDLHSGCELTLDKSQINSVIQNLIKNALEAMTGGQITISSRQVSNVVEISVEDTGPGISEEILDSLFKPFATFGKTKGTGLGLAGAKSVVTNHGGKISAENTGTGARFTIRLPR